MDPATYDIKIIRGVRFRKEFIWKDASGPVDVTGYTATANLHPEGQNTEETNVAMAVAVGDVDGKFVVSMTAAATTALDWQNGEWDLAIAAPSEDPDRILEGLVKVRD